MAAYRKACYQGKTNEREYSKAYGEEEQNLARIDDLLLKSDLLANYEGDVKDRLPHGTGNAYYRTGGRYEGEWRDGKRSGYGKEYYPDGTLRYDGSWENGLRNGYGKSYYTTGELAYEGEWAKDKPINYPESHLTP